MNNNSTITFTTTATVRPELIDQTYLSFSKNLIGIDLKQCDLVINIDPIPYERVNEREEIINVAKKYFGKITQRLQDQPNFPDALKWTWMNTVTPYIFNLEDDWILLHQVNINDVIALHKTDPTSIGVSLNAYIFGSNQFRIRLSPCLLNGDWARTAASHLLTNSCPEKQLRNRIPKHLIRRMLNYPKYTNSKNATIMVHDIGRAWRETRRLVKNSTDTHGFTSWKKK
jgi:hypothetical protein